MAAFLGRRLIEMIPVVILVTAVSFALIFVLPGDPAMLIIGDRSAARRSYTSRCGGISGWTARSTSSTLTGSARSCRATLAARRATRSRSLTG